MNSIHLPLLGQHQRMNAAVAVATVRTLVSQIPVTDDIIRAGLSRVHWAGRLQLATRPSGQKILLDGAQITACASLREALPTTMGEAFLVIAGSLYLIGEAIELLHLFPAKAQNERGLNEWSGVAATAEAAFSSQR